MKTALPSPFAKRLFNEAFSDRSVPRGHPMAHIRQRTAGDGVQSPHKSPRRESPEDLRRLGSGLNQTERRGSAFDRFAASITARVSASEVTSTASGFPPVVTSSATRS